MMELPSPTLPCSATATIISDESLDHRFSILKKTNQQTQQLNFCLFNPDKKRVDIWLHHLEPHLTQCKTIKMKLPFRFNDNLMINMSHTFYKLRTLRELKINATGSKYITDKGLMSLNKSLSKLHRLEKLKLDFSRCQHISNQSLINLGHSIYRLQHLSSLSLTFSACEKITNDGLTKLTQRISKLPLLKKLNLIFSNCNEVTDEGVVRLSQSISNMTTLQDMTLKFYRCSLTDKSLVSVGENFSKLKPLRRLSLTFSSGIKTNHKGISADGLRSLSFGLSQLTNLESLAVKFGWSDTLPDNGLASLNKGILNLKNLKALQLGFYYCDNITNLGVKALTNNIQELKKLQSFKINLWTCNSITKDAFMNLAFDVSKAPSLKNAQFASESYGWLSFNNKSSLLKFATGLALQRFGKMALGKKNLVLLFIGLALLLAFWTPITRCLL